MSARKPGARVVLTIALALGCMLTTAATATAAYDHSTVEKTFQVTSPLCLEPQAEITDMAVDETAKVIYLACGTYVEKVIERYNYDGSPAPFPISRPYLSGNKIIEDPATPNGRVGQRVAVSNSPTNNGYVFTAEGNWIGASAYNVGIFRPTGDFAGILPQPNASTGLGDSTDDVAVAPDGEVYVSGRYPGRRVDKFNTAFKLTERLYRFPDSITSSADPNEELDVDSAGSLWLRHDQPANKLSKFEADQFSKEISLGTSTGPSVIAAYQGFPSPFYIDPIPVSDGFVVDPFNDAVIAGSAGALRQFSSGNASELSYEYAPAFGAPATAVAATEAHQVFTADDKTITRYGPGNIVPDITTPKPDLDEVGHTDAVVTGEVDLAGGGPVTECIIQYGTSPGSLSSTEACTPSSFAGDQTVSAQLTGLTTGTTYHYRVKATNAGGSNTGYVREVTPAFVLKVRTLPATDVEPNEAVLNGSLDPDGLANTTYYFEYGADTDYGQATPVEDASEGFGVEPASAAIDNLSDGRVWHYRLVASNENGTTYGPDETFRTASVPDITGARATEVTATSAVLNARVNPVGFATEYAFEYGQTPSYGTRIPLAGSPESEIGSGTSPVEVAQTLTGLAPGVTYHFRVVASNEWGTSFSADTTFDFSPPACPNGHVRQETGASYLPDCRAYELVSPRAAGGVLLFPNSEIEATAEGEYGFVNHWHMNSGLAQNPPRFNFLGADGSIEGLDAPNGIFEILFDDYVSTRTNTGWVTTVPGLHGKDVQYAARRECSESFDVCTDHNEGNEEYGSPLPRAENAPYLSDTEGDKLGRLPTNLSIIPGGAYFNGDQRLAGGGGHFVFSSSNVRFTPDGVLGGLGSAYANDIAEQTIEVISKLPEGGDIPADASTKQIGFPHVSPDGSHILMQNDGPGGVHLWMRVDGLVTYDVMRGTSGEYAGATRNGRKVYFITGQQVPDTGDTDNSRDLFMWEEGSGPGDDAVTLVSQGNGNGNSDECSATWTVDCGVKALESERAAAVLWPLKPGMDDRLADGSGDLYFISPESLDPDTPAIPGQRNVYLSRDGELQLVTILDPGTRINRVQISPDGDHSAFLTASRLTAYDNQGYLQMYTFDADAESIRCASCNPNGQPPQFDVEASQSGPFMSDDGRTFFATKDSLVPRDSNGIIIDVYEFVDGRPQLISAGTGSRDFTGGSKVLNFAVQPVSTGLEAVSANGVDVYFSTFDVLIEEDENGEFVKFYDARVGGGFPPPPSLNTCAAADECHAPDGLAPTPGLIGSGDQLGTGGNVESQQQAKKKKKKAKKKKNAKKKKKKKSKRGSQGRRG